MQQSDHRPRACQLCGQAPLEKFVVPQRTVFWLCRRCGLYQYGPLVDKTSYGVSYQAFYDEQRRRKLRTAAVRLNRIAALLQEQCPRHLDVGCSLGATLQAAAKRGWDSVGVDVNPDVVQWCRQHGFRAALSDGLALPFDDRSFDVVTAWHIIEHVADVKQTLAEWRRVLRTDGVLAIETPDASSPKVRILGARYARFWRPEHTYTFTPASLSAFFEQAGLEIVRRPVLGRLADLSPAMAAYAVAYQGQHALKRALGIGKAFQIFARRRDNERGAIPTAPHFSRRSRCRKPLS